MLPLIDISHLWHLGLDAVTLVSMVAWDMPGSCGLILIVLVAS